MVLIEKILYDNIMSLKNSEFFTNTQTNAQTNAQPNTQPNTQTNAPASVYIFFIFLGLIWLLFAIWAAKLSWEANTLVGWDNIPKIIFSIGAFITCLSYLVSYFICKLDLVNYIKRSKPSQTIGGYRKH
jgi:hypothetical protein